MVRSIRKVLKYSLFLPTHLLYCMGSDNIHNQLNESEAIHQQYNSVGSHNIRQDTFLTIDEWMQQAMENELCFS